MSSARCGLGDAAANGPGLDAAPENLEALGQRPAVGRREPEAKQEPVAPGAVLVGVGRAAVVHDVVVQELHVAGAEIHLVAELVRDGGEEIERLVLLGRQPRHSVDLLRGLDERARVLGGEAALPARRRGQALGGPLAADLLALSRPVVVAAQQDVQVGSASADRVAHRGHARHAAPAARRAERTHKSPTTSQRSVCQRSGPFERALAREVTPWLLSTAGCTTSP